jgi:DNA-binding MarR family transcriptional regulator
MADVYELAGRSRRVSERDASALDTTVARWHVLSVVSQEALTVPEIARRLGQVRQGVQRVVDELVAVAQLEPVPNPRRPRSPRFRATGPGLEILERLWARSGPSRARQLAGSGLDVADLQHARDTVRRLLAVLTEDAPEPVAPDQVSDERHLRTAPSGERAARTNSTGVVARG